jgi:hypothetical protein
MHVSGFSRRGKCGETVRCGAEKKVNLQRGDAWIDPMHAWQRICFIVLEEHDDGY